MDNLYIEFFAYHDCDIPYSGRRMTVKRSETVKLVVPMIESNHKLIEWLKSRDGLNIKVLYACVVGAVADYTRHWDSQFVQLRKIYEDNCV